MRLENSFAVPARPEMAWRLLNDVPRIVPCMPGAELTEVVDENTWKATMHVKVGPISLEFGTDLRRDQVDEGARRVVLSAKARELRGRGGAQVTIESSLAERDGGTQVNVVTELTLQGAVAQYGRAIVAEVAGRMTKEFAECVARQLEGEGEGSDLATIAPVRVKPVGGLGLALGALWRSLLRVFRSR